jgi:hypothetical protein
MSEKWGRFCKKTDFQKTSKEKKTVCCSHTELKKTKRENLKIVGIGKGGPFKLH